MKLSVVIATLNRLKWLQKCVESVRKSCGGMDYELILVDGGSRDGTQSWARGQRVVFIEQGAAYGAVHAFNAGFYAAEGDYVAALNDDCIVIGDTLRLACDYLDAHPKCGQVAIPWKDNTDMSKPHAMHVPIGKQLLDVIYANFGVTRRELGDKVGWWGDWEHYAGDAELSFQLLNIGYMIDELAGGEVEHYRVQDETRRVCYPNPAFKRKWYTFDASHIIAMYKRDKRPIKYRQRLDFDG